MQYLLVKFVILVVISMTLRPAAPSPVPPVPGAPLELHKGVPATQAVIPPAVGR